MAGYRRILPIHRGARFANCDPAGAEDPSHDDSAWREVVIPHDWAIEGRFDRGNDIQQTTILEDGEARPAEHVGRTGGLPHVGVGWYRIRLDLDDALRKSLPGRRVYVEFDGVMSHSSVYCNGGLVGSWPYGYASFSFDITDHVSFAGENLLAVRVDNKPNASRWYPGAGIYRNARIVVVGPVHVAYSGVWVSSQPEPSGGATVHLQVRLRGTAETEGAATVQTRIVGPDGKTVADGETAAEGRLENGEFVAEDVVRLDAARLWSVEAPVVYRAVVAVDVGGTVVDEVETTFGIRSARFDAEEGFLLNGRRTSLKGVCMHHDLGALGAAVNRRAMERQLEILKDMGCNAIRTSHNPPAPELLDLTDRMGFLVIDEAFDEWRVAKVDNGYHRLFDDWAERDLRAFIRRDRNHPSVILWSIGNEVRDQSLPEGRETAAWLTSICHEEDPTRPVTAGFNNSEDAIANGLAAAVDVPGWNYKPHLYRRYHAEHPQWPMYGSETESCVSSRGEYYLPVVEERDGRRDSIHVSSYDVVAPPWGYSPEYEFTAQDGCPFVAGEFVWTGFDYLGEPTPYKTEWPSRSAYFGIVDLAGFPKDRFFLYRSKWSPDDTLHLLPHWNWEGREGETIPVHCYTSHPEVELFLNGTSLGRRRKRALSRGTRRTTSAAAQDESPVSEDVPEVTATVGHPELLDRYRLRWDVPYAPGRLLAVAYDEAGVRVAETEVRTARSPARLAITTDRSIVTADGRDLCFVSVSLLDEEGTLCPTSDIDVVFAASGPGRIVATDNGDQTSLVPFQERTRRMFHGRCLAITAAEAVGDISITAEASGASANVQGAAVSIRAVAPPE